MAAKRKPLTSFFGVLSKKTANEIEENIRKFRTEQTGIHQKRLKRIISD